MTRTWLDDCLDRLAARDVFAYRPGLPSASEPAAVSALALIAHGRIAEATRALDELERLHGAANRGATDREPARLAWESAWALSAWAFADRRGEPGARRRDASAKEALRVLMASSGKDGGETQSFVGHDPTLIAWPWVDGTHSWLEPTALGVLALKAVGRFDDRRARNGVRLIEDRQLPGGGCNYGNTVVLGQVLRAHLQPTGMALVAWIGEPSRSERVRTLDFAVRHWRAARTAPSLGWILMGLTAHGAWPRGANDALGQAARSPSAAGFGEYHIGLLTLAATGPSNPWLEDVRRAGTDADESIREHAVRLRSEEREVE
ncbi:MAG: hypothetical protein FJ297_03540 [Planctomycetes bacterium]|nr:hypothetical protein [Planctomycetota bacterium]